MLTLTSDSFGCLQPHKLCAPRGVSLPSPMVVFVVVVLLLLLVPTSAGALMAISTYQQAPSGHCQEDTITILNRHATTAQFDMAARGH